MVEQLDAEQIRERAVSSMGGELGEMYFDLWNQMAWLHLKWNQYVYLFGEEDARIDVLNRTAPAFFYLVQRTFFEDVLLHICRLMDLPKRGRHRRLTLKALPELIDDDAVRRRVSDALDGAFDRALFARKWRDRRIAHKDLLTVRRQHPKPLSAATRQDVDRALAGIRDVMHEVEHHYLGSTAAYEWTDDPLGAHSLVGYLRRGLHGHNPIRGPGFAG